MESNGRKHHGALLMSKLTVKMVLEVPGEHPMEEIRSIEGDCLYLMELMKVIFQIIQNWRII